MNMKYFTTSPIAQHNVTDFEKPAGNRCDSGGMSTLLIFCLTIGAASLPVQAWAEKTGCTDINGSIMGNVTGSDPVTVIGTVSGDLKGATRAIITGQKKLSDGTVNLQMQHVFVTDDRSTLKTNDEAVWIPVPGNAGVFHMSTNYSITGGSGRFDNSKGWIKNHGEADTNTGLVTLGYNGEVCGQN